MITKRFIGKHHPNELLSQISLEQKINGNTIHQSVNVPGVITRANNQCKVYCSSIKTKQSINCYLQLWGDIWISITTFIAFSWSLDWHHSMLACFGHYLYMWEYITVAWEYRQIVAWRFMSNQTSFILVLGPWVRWSQGSTSSKIFLVGACTIGRA